MANTVKLDSLCPSVYGISVRRYQQLAKDGLVPPTVDGYVDFVASTKALMAYYQKLVQGAGSITLTEERARLTKVQADIATLDYQKELGNLLDKEEVVLAWAGMIQASRSRFLSIPVKMAPLLEGVRKREIKGLLEDAVYDALNELSGLKVEGVEMPAAIPEGQEEPTTKDTKEEPKKARKAQKGNGVKKKCEGCGRLIDPRATFCRKCASKQREKKKNGDTKKTKKR